jgi:hypothetical protein
MRADRAALEGEMRKAGLKTPVIPPGGSAAKSIPLDKPADWYSGPEARRIANIDCKWNGPSWPFATTITLRGLANVLNDHSQNAISPADYRRTLAIYTHNHRLKLDDGRVIPWIDENQNPETGEWIARTMKIRKGTFYGRGDHYNHSAYCDLIITGLTGLRPSSGDTFEVNPLADPAWDWFCLDNVPYHGRSVSIARDRNGQKFGCDAGLAVYVDGQRTASRETLGRLAVRIS